MVEDGSRARARMDDADRLMLRALTPREQPVSPRVRSASTGGALGLALEASPRSEPVRQNHTVSQVLVIWRVLTWFIADCTRAKGARISALQQQASVTKSQAILQAQLFTGPALRVS